MTDVDVVKIETQMDTVVFDSIRVALEKTYKIPEGWTLFKVDVYDPQKYPEPHLAYQKSKIPGARYVVILTSMADSVSAIGVEAINALELALSILTKKL